VGIGIDLKGIGDIFTGAGKFAGDIRQAVTGDISAEKKAELAIKAQEIEAALATAQTEVNKIEASSSNLFVAGWRPMVGWICALGLAYAVMLEPLIAFVARLAGYQGEFPKLDGDILNTTLFGMLGLGLFRTAEKITGKTGNH
jgi:roadblock/LC7 domain-containing protein